MLKRDIGRLPVVSRDEPGRMVGYLNRASILSAWTRQMHEDLHETSGLGEKSRRDAGVTEVQPRSQDRDLLSLAVLA